MMRLSNYIAVAVIATVVTLGLCAGCGGSSQVTGNQPSLDLTQDQQPITSNEPQATSDDKTPWHNLFNSKHYSGYLAVMFKGGTGIRLRNGRFISLPLDGGGQVGVESINESVISHGGIINLGIDLPEETIERALEKASREGKKLHDWNLYYTIKIENPGHAEELYKKLAESEVVEWIHPIPIPQVMGGVTPDISGDQTYIKSEAETGGLNIQAAWDVGIAGEGVRIVDEEYNWNFEHEDLPIGEDDIIAQGMQYPPGFDINDPKYVQHGTAVAGVLNAIDNGLGVKGIVHSSILKFFQTDISTDVGMLIVADLLKQYAKGVSGEDVFVRPGDVILMEIASPGPNTPPDTGCEIDPIAEEPTYCIPEEAYYLPFIAIQDVTELGIIVIEGAANGGIDLGDPEAQAILCGSEPCPNLAVDDSGAIMVAASMGGKDNNKPWWSNWGNRINAYAWGYGVTTTGYGDHPDSDITDENKWYTANFNGTSSAAALVAGAVALVQSYVKDVYKIIPEEYEDKFIVYLDAWQMRGLIDQAGIDGDPDYNIGKKPDVGAMMELVANGEVIPNVSDLFAKGVGKPVSEYAVAGIRYDMDKDGRAELISYYNGTWKVDLSTIPPDVPDPHPDNYGEWDLVIDIPSASASASASASTLAFPVVHDYDSDGDADLALYDSKNGVWYIKYTPSPLEGEGWGEGELEWDRIIDYSSDPAWKSHSRPVPGDYDGDAFLDLALATPDGHWLIDYGARELEINITPPAGLGTTGSVEINILDDLGDFDEDVKFLTDEQLAEAPGWAYLPGVIPGNKSWLFYKHPDGSENEGKVGGTYYPEFNPSWWLDGLPPIYGQNDDIISFMKYQYSGSTPSIGITIKWDNGIWEMGFGDYWEDLQNFSPEDGYGEVLCMPIIADYNGDNVDDRAVKCGSTWKIAYTLPDIEDFRIIETDDSIVSLPAYVYPGGINYQDIVSIYNYYKYQLGCGKGEECNIFNVEPPIGPHFTQCIKYWAPPPHYCWDK